MRRSWKQDTTGLPCLRALCFMFGRYHISCEERFGGTLGAASLSASCFQYISPLRVSATFWWFSRYLRGFLCCSICHGALSQWSSLLLLLQLFGSPQATPMWESRHHWRARAPTAPLTAMSVSLPLLRQPYSLKHNNIEIRPINNPSKRPPCSSESHASLT